MVARKMAAAFFSAVLVFGTVPTQALAEVAQQTREASGQARQAEGEGESDQLADSADVAEELQAGDGTQDRSDGSSAADAVDETDETQGNGAADTTGETTDEHGIGDGESQDGVNEPAANQAAVEFRVGATDPADTWIMFRTIQEAEEAARENDARYVARGEEDDSADGIDQVSLRVPISKVELRLRDAQGEVTPYMRAQGCAWDASWYEQGSESPKAHVDSSDEDGKTEAPTEAGTAADAEAPTGAGTDDQAVPGTDAKADAQGQADAEGQANAEGQADAEGQTDATTQADAELEASEGDGSQNGVAEDADDAGANDALAPFVDLRVLLTGDVAQSHEVWYRVHVQSQGWLQWVHDGDPAAADNEELVDDVQVVLVAKADQDDDANVPIVQQSDEKEPQTKPVSTTPQSTKEKSEAAPAKDALKTEAATTAVPTVTYSAHAQTYGWMAPVSNGDLAGTVGEAKRLEAVRVSLAKGVDGGIAYRAHAQTYGWLDAVSDGALGGTTGEGKRLESMQIWLTGNVAKNYDVWYQVQVQTYGWLGWVKNGESAGTTGQGKRLEAIRIKLAPKGATPPTPQASVIGKDSTTQAAITYRANTENMGWMGWVGNGAVAGTTGVSAKLEGFTARLVGLNDSDLHYTAHVQGIGWQGEVTGGQDCGAPGQHRRLEAIRMRLSGTAGQNYDIYYRCHIQSYGWLNWAKNNEDAGSTGMSRRVEAIQVVLVPKGGAAPHNDSGRRMACVYMPTLRYCGHVQTYGWRDWVTDGASAGTVGESKRVEGLIAEVVNTNLSGEVRINAHVQSYGWRGYVGQGQVAGTTGESKRVEAIRVQLTGELEQNFDVWYRVHAQSLGWLGWTKNGESAGSAALSRRLEAVQMKLLPKGSAAPGSTARPFVDGNTVTKLGYQNPAGYYQVSSKNVTITSAASWPFNYITPSRIGVFASRDDCVNAFIQRAREYVGTPYVWNYACAPGVGVDCIGLVYQCAYACGMDLGGGTGYDDFNPYAHYISGNSGWHSHDANNFWNYGRALHVPVGARQRGDVIWYPGHVSIYLGNNTIIEAYTPETGVIYSSIDHPGEPQGCIRLFQ